MQKVIVGTEVELMTVNVIIIILKAVAIAVMKGNKMLKNIANK